MNKKIIFVSLIVITALVVAVVLPKVFASKGKQCYKNGDMNCAINSFKNAHMLAPMDLHYEYYYAKSLTKVKPTYTIQKEMFALAKNAKNNNAKNLANNTVNYWKSGIIGKLGENYIEQVPSDDDIVRWNKNSFPLKVYVKKETNIPEYYGYAISQALSLWTKSISFVNFKFTDNKSDAQIIIDIKPLPQDLCVNGVCKYITGYTTPKRTGNQLKCMEIILYDKEPNGTFHTEANMFHTVSHELGHALGIMGHSYSPYDLMYSTQEQFGYIGDVQTSDVNTLSRRDINTIELLYRLEPSVTDKGSGSTKLIYAPIILGTKEDILDRKIQEAKDYIQRAPQLSTGYIELASAYLKKGKTKEAEDTLLQALNYTKTTDETFMIYYNLAITACMAKQFNKAQGYADKARQMKNAPELAEIDYLIKNKIVPSL